MGTDGAIRVDGGDLYSYGRAVGAMHYDSIGTHLALTADLGMAAQEAFAPLPGGGTAGTGAASAGHFAGAPTIVAQQSLACQRIERGFADIATGLFAIASGATVVANCYTGTEAASAATVDDVRYAWADPTAARPAGLPETIDGTTLRGASGGAPGAAALTAPDSDAVRVEPGGGMVSVEGASPTLSFRHVFADGSARETTQATAVRPDLAVARTVTTTHLAADGSTVLRSTSTETVTRGGVLQSRVDRSGATTVTTEMVEGRPRVTVTAPRTPGGEPEVVTTREPEVVSQVASSDTAVECLGPGPIEVADMAVLDRVAR